MLPLSNTAEAARRPIAKLFLLEDKLLQRYMSSLGVAKRPPTLDGYLKTVVTPTLEVSAAGRLRGREVRSRLPPWARLRRDRHDGEHDLCEVRQRRRRPTPVGAPGFLFRYIAREAGRLGWPSVHSFEGAGNFFRTAGTDPLLMEPVFNDPELRRTNFVIIHGGGVYANHAGAMLWKPNVYVDTSLMTLAYTPARLAEVLRAGSRSIPRGAVRFRCLRVRTGHGLGADRLDRDEERESGAGVGAHRHDQEPRGQPRPRRGDRHNGDAHKRREALQVGVEIAPPMHSRQRLAADLRTLGVAAGDIVMVHASVRAVGEIAGGPDQIHLAVKDALTGEGTIVMYAGCPRYVDEVGRGNLSASQEAEVLEKLPPFEALPWRP